MTAQDNNRLGGQRQKRNFWLFSFIMMMKKIRWIIGALILALLPVTAFSAGELSIAPITWNVIGLNKFPVGVRVGKSMKKTKLTHIERVLTI